MEEGWREKSERGEWEEGWRGRSERGECFCIIRYLLRVCRFGESAAQQGGPSSSIKPIWFRERERERERVRRRRRRDGENIKNF